ncbi:MAG: glycoside hydrolase family 16 protein [Candidatus Thiodiazotropha sp.]
MMVNRIQHWSFWAIVFVSTLLLSGCNSGGGDNDGSDSITETTSNASREYVLVWSDEFNQGTSPSVEKWTIETGYGDNGWGNDESQLYTDSPDNVRVENGNLVITARCDSGVCGVRDGSITSARINTKDKFEVKYGKIQARIKPP